MSDVGALSLLRRRAALISQTGSQAAEQNGIFPEQLQTSHYTRLLLRAPALQLGAGAGLCCRRVPRQAVAGGAGQGGGAGTAVRVCWRLLYLLFVSALLPGTRRNLRNDLLVAADSITNTMSSLVKELHSGKR